MATRSPNLIKPQRLVPGDNVGIIAPASAPPDPKAVDRAMNQVECLGFRPVLGRSVRMRHGFLAGSDRDRAGDVMRMFMDRRVRGIICLRGGYGAARLVERLDFSAIRMHPKVFAGYSDITTLHCAFLTRAGLVTFHSPMLNEGLGRADFPACSNESFLHTVTISAPSGSLLKRCKPREKVTIVRRGVAEGRLLGGNLSVLMTTLHTPIQPRFRNRILFLEDVAEPPYRLDRMLTHLLNAGLLQQVAGVAFGTVTQCLDPLAKRAREYRQTALDVIRERLAPLGIPVLAGLPFGHQPINATIPTGIRARLDANRGDLEIMESAVR